MTYNINHADIYEWAKNYKGEPFDAVLCDPPYELGFMGKSWDSTGIAFNKDMWEAVFNILKPGGHLLAFSGSRTYHRMACAIEDAGFEIRDMIEWVYGSGFPKSLNIGKAVDKIQGNEREDLGFREDFRKRARKNGVESKDYIMAGGWKSTEDTVGKLDRGHTEWEGYGTALKPAHEPCVLARKPIEGTVAQNALKHGTGGLNLDGSRVGTETINIHNAPKGTFAGGELNRGSDTSSYKDSVGRFPANLIHDGSDEVVGLFPDTGGGKFIKQTRSRKGFMLSGSENNIQEANAPDNYGDSGSAARFFYTAKASKSERNAGLEKFEVKDPDIRSDTAKGSYTSKGIAPQTNYHPTVKPLSLTKYLANLIKPPTGGRLLVPFSGSGSEMIGALQAGWEHVEGVELTEEYIPIAEARIRYWTDKLNNEPLQLL